MFLTDRLARGKMRTVLSGCAMCIVLCPQLGAQIITTLAGTNTLGPADGTAALQASIGPNLVAGDSHGNVYYIDVNNVVTRINTQGTLSRFAGNGIQGFSGDGQLATNASLNAPAGLFVDSSGNVYIADTNNFRIRKVDTNGVITTVAGNGVQGVSADGLQALNSSIGPSYGVALDSAGNLYIADSVNNRIAKVDTNGVLTTFAGTGQAGYSGDNGPAKSAKLNLPLSVGVDPANNVLIADRNNHAIRRVDASGTIKTIAGNGNPGFSGDNGPAVSAQLDWPWDLSVDSQGNILFVDYANDRIRKIDPKGIITTVAGNGTVGPGTDNVAATSSKLNYPFSVAWELTGSFLIADYANFEIRRVTSGTITTIAGTGRKVAPQNGSAATSALLSSPTKIALAPTGGLLIADYNNHYVERVDPSSGAISVVAGIGVAAFTADGVPAASSALNYPHGITTDSSGNVYIADGENNRIRKVDVSGSITTIAGTGVPGYQGDNGPAKNALLGRPQGLRFDSAGNLVFADSLFHIVRSINGQGVIRTIAGTGTGGYNGDNMPASKAQLSTPTDVAFDKLGNLYIADSGNNRIRKVAADGTITTVAGTGVGGFSGDGSGTAQQLNNPQGVNFDANGNLLIADRDNDRIRLLTAGGQLMTVAGDGVRRWSGDGSPAASASLAQPEGVIADGAGNIYIADRSNNRIREIVAAAPAFGASPGQLTFTANSGGSATPAQTIHLASSIPGVAFSAQGASSWISVTPSSGTLPADVQISVDPSQLAAGNMSGNVMIMAPNANPAGQMVTVNVAVAAANPAKLGVGNQGINFALQQGASPATSLLNVSDTGGGSLGFTASAGTTSGGGWLQISASSGSATPSAPFPLTVTATPGNLAAGTYSGSIAIASSTTGEQIIVPVTMAVSAAQAKIVLSQTGLTFVAVAGGGAVLPQSLGILNGGAGVMNWTAQVSAPSGSGWLSLSSTAGTVTQPLVDVSSLDVRVDPTGLAAGNYFANVQVSAPGADIQTALVVLNVLPAGSNPGPDVRPTGLVFTGVAGGDNPGSQNIMVSNVTGNPQLNFTSNIAYVQQSNWLSYLPASAAIAPGSPATLVVQPDFSKLTPNIYRSSLTLVLTDGTIRTVGIVAVVTAGSASGGLLKDGTHAASGCSPSKLQILPVGSQTSFSAPINQPMPLEVQVLDDCSNPVTSQGNTASVTAAFSNGDPGLHLSYTQNGKWSGTWQPQRGGAGGSVSVNVSAFQSLSSGKLLANQIALTANLTSGATLPVVSPGSVLNAASFAAQAPVAPGALISVFGSGLADTGAAGSAPLPTNLGGTQVLLGTQSLPLVYTSDGQLNAQVPYNLSVNTALQLQVQRGNALSLPQAITVAPAQPAIFTADQSGHGQGAIVNTNNVLVDSGAPAAVGDTVVIYCTGLGAVDPPVNAGSPAPSSPLARAVSPVTVTIGGVPATLNFAGLAPTFAGLYQINAVVPAGVTPGGQVPVVVAVSGQTSPTVTMAVR